MLIESTHQDNAYVNFDVWDECTCECLDEYLLIETHESFSRKLLVSCMFVLSVILAGVVWNK